MNMTTENIVLVPDELNTCTISPRKRRNICTMFNKSGNFQIVVDTTSCLFGDELVFIFSKAESNLSLEFPSEQFILTYCGGPTQQITLVGVGNNTDNDGDVSSDTWQTQFFFDGEKFLYTFDIG